jgi:hypothetical protein
MLAKSHVTPRAKKSFAAIKRPPSRSDAYALEGPRCAMSRRGRAKGSLKTE